MTTKIRSPFLQEYITRRLNKDKSDIAKCMLIPDRFDAYAAVGSIMIEVCTTKLYTLEERDELLKLIKQVYLREE